jgi:hypothetical protein
MKENASMKRSCERKRTIIKIILIENHIVAIEEHIRVSYVAEFQLPSKSNLLQLTDTKSFISKRKETLSVIKFL